MKTSVSRIFTVLVTAMMFVGTAFTQNDTITAAAGDKYVISAKAGGVNLVEGTVGIVRKNGQSGHMIKGDKLEIGDRVSTGADGKAEILLNPGSYLRLGGNSAFEFKTTSLDNLQLKLAGGSAIFEVFADDEFRVVVNAPKVKYTIIESGIYRVDVTPDGSSKIAVWKGRAQVGNSAAGVVKSGREATVIDNQLAIAKFDRDDKDSLETWSKTRAKELARISSKLKGQDLRTSLMQSYLGNRWNMYNSFGLWVYDYAFGSYCFLPFGQGWSSPYGYGFGRSIWHYNLPWTVYNQPSNPTTSTGGGSSQPSTTPIVSAGDRNGSVPPFERMQRNGGGRGIVDFPSHPKERNTNSGPVYTPPIIVSAPPTDSSNTKGKP